MTATQSFEIPSPVWVEFIDTYLRARGHSGALEIEYNEAKGYWFYMNHLGLQNTVDINKVTKIYRREDYPEYYL